MFKFEEICELIRLVGSTGVASVEVERAGHRVRIEGASRGGSAPASAGLTADPAIATPPLEPAFAPTGPPPAAEDEAVHYVTSPIVGTFYRAPNPDAEPYVKVGDLVHRGQVLCIVEAMKLMNEIESDMDGTVVKIEPDNAQPVEFGERLFALRSG